MIILRWVFNTLGVMLVSYVIPGIVVQDFYIALIVALVYGLINAIIRPLLLLLTLPVNILTLGLLTFVINALLLWLTARLVPGFYIAGFIPAFWGALVLWAVSWFTSSVLKE